MRSPSPHASPYPTLHLHWLALILIALPVGVHLWFLRAYAVSLPFWDEWEFWWSMKGLDTGNWHHAFWIPHNEHRLVVTRVFYFFLRYVFALDVRVAMYFNLGLVCLTLWGLWRLLRASVTVSLWVFVPVAFVVLSLAQWENVLWGWQIAIYAMVCGSVWSLVWLAQTGRTTLLGAIGAAIVASLSFVNGLMIWPAGLVYLLLARRSRGRVLAWCGAGALMSVIYFRNYVNQVTRPSPTALVRPDSLAEFFEAPVGILRDDPLMLPTMLLGNVGAILSPENLTLATVNGLLIVISFLLCLVALWQLRAQWSTLPLALVALGLVGFMSSLTIIVGRMGYWDSEFVLSSRYLTITMLGLVATYLLAVAIAHALPENGAWLRRMGFAISIILCVAFFIFLPAGYQLGLRKGAQQALERRAQREIVVTFATRSDDELATVYPKTLRERLLYWQSRRLTPFDEK